MQHLSSKSEFKQPNWSFAATSCGNTSLGSSCFPRVEGKHGFLWPGGRGAEPPSTGWALHPQPKPPGCCSQGTTAQAELLAHPSPPVCGRVRMNLALSLQLHKALSEFVGPVPCWLWFASTLTDEREASCFHPAAKSWVPQVPKISAGGDIRERNEGLQVVMDWRRVRTGSGREGDVCAGWKGWDVGLGRMLSSVGRSQLPAPCAS